MIGIGIGARRRRSGGVAAPGVATAARIPSDTTRGRGFIVEVDVPDANAGTIDGTKMIVATTTPSYTAAGGVTTMTRLIRAAHENPLLRNLNSRLGAGVSSAGTTTYQVALSQHVFANDSVVELRLLAGWCGANPPQVITCTNASPITAPTACTAHWMTPPRRKLAKGVEIFEVMADGILDPTQAGSRTVAAVLVTATGATSGLTVSTYVTALSLSTLYTTPSGCPPAMVYAASLDFAAFTTGETVTVDATVYPWMGASLATNAANILSFRPQLHRIDPGFATIYCEVNPGAGTAGGTASTNPASVVAGNNFGTVLNTAATLRNSTNGETTYANVVLYISENECIRTAATDRTAGVLGPTVTRRAGTTKSLCRIKKDGNFVQPLTGMHFEDITFTDTNDNRTMWNNAAPADRSFTVLNCALDLTVSNASPDFTDCPAYIISADGDWGKPTNLMRQTITGGSGANRWAWNGMRIKRNALFSKLSGSELLGIHRWNCYVADEAGVLGFTGTGATIAAAAHSKLVSIINCAISDTAANVGSLIDFMQSNNACSGIQVRHMSTANRRMNAYYTDTGTIASLSATSIVEQNSFTYCAGFEANQKTELFLGGAAVVNSPIRWSYGYKVGFYGNLWRSTFGDSAMGNGGDPWEAGGPVRSESDRRGRVISGDSSLPVLFGADFNLLSDAAAAADATNIALDASGGAPETDWTKNIARDLVPAGHRIVPFDMWGNARLNDGTGAAGAVERP